MPELVNEQGALIAQGHERLHAIPAPPWLVPRVGGGSAIVHLDLHPLNVMITAGGPVVIDWSNAGISAPEAEVADLWIIMANAEIPGSGLMPKIMALVRGLFLRAFLRHIDKTAVRTYLRIAAAHRLRDRNMTGPERARIERFVERWAL